MWSCERLFTLVLLPEMDKTYLKLDSWNCLGFSFNGSRFIKSSDRGMEFMFQKFLQRPSSPSNNMFCNPEFDQKILLVGDTQLPGDPILILEKVVPCSVVATTLSHSIERTFSAIWPHSVVLVYGGHTL